MKFKIFTSVLSLFITLVSAGLFAQCPPPAATATTPTCGGTATLTASGSTGLYRWYNTSTGGSVLGTGANYITPALTAASQLYYVEAVNSLSAPTCFSGRVAVLIQTNPIASPGSVTGATAACGSTANISASGGPSAFYRWYSESTGGNELGLGNGIAVSPVATDTFWVSSLGENPSGSQNYSSVGTHSWTVPAGVTSIQIDMAGAKGGDQCNGTQGGRGGRLQATIPVTPGQTLQINVGGAGTFGNCSWTWYSGGFNGGGSGYRGGGGGGASDIRIGGTALSNRILVAGGGGGAGYACGNENGGNGGGLVAQDGNRCGTTHSNDCCYAGGGATQNGGGNGSCCYLGGSGSLGTGQNAWGGSSSNGHGGGGGGYYGGGGAALGASGGGGSSFSDASASNVTHTIGHQNASGYVNISWIKQVCESNRVPVVVTVTPIGQPTSSNINALCAASITLSASGSASGLYSWFADNALSQPLATSSSYSVVGITNTDTFYVTAHSPKTQMVSTTFNFNGSVQQYTVPAGVTSILVDVRGAKGGNATNASSGPGGLGGRVQTTLSVTPGQVLNLYVGGQGSPGTGSWQWNPGGYNGGGQGRMQGGGGGASDIRMNGTSLNDRVVVAGGGGGGGIACNSTNHERGGMGGGLVGEDGYRCNSPGQQNCEGGTGGTQSSAGNAPCYGGTSGSFGSGGNASSSNCGSGHGGGGAGYYGGGGGGCGAGGGGGSSYTSPTITQNTTHTQGFQNGDGQIIISRMEAIPFCESQPVEVIATIANVAFTSLLNDTINCGSPAQLTAVASQGTVSWYNVPTGGTPLFQGVGYALPNQFQSSTYYVESNTMASQTFAFSGGIQTWVVPAGVFQIDATISGAQGGSNSHSSGGLGGSVTAKLNVTPGETLYFNVGGTTNNGQAGYNGGGSTGSASSTWMARGGGGGTDIRSGGTTLNHRVLVAGGGGGAGANCNSTEHERGGAGGGLTGANGAECNSQTSSWSGRGGSQTSGGANAPNCGGGMPFAGSFGQGGNGTCTDPNYGGAGGGGYYGGGGGGYGGGGGGSSYADPARTSAVSHVQGNRNGNGQIVISYVATACSTPRLPVSVLIDSLPAPTVSPDMAGCAPLTHTFTATGGTGTLSWTDVPFGQGIILGTGSTYTATANDTTEYFVGEVAANGCPSKRAKATLFATPLPDVMLVSPTNILCNNQGQITLTAGTPGGVFSGLGIIDTLNGILDLSQLSPGVVSVAYSISLNGCSNSDTTHFNLLPAPNASIVSLPAIFCEYDNAVALQTQDTIGTWIGNGIVQDTLFSPASAMSGAHTLVYHITAANGCVDSDSIQMLVNPKPDATILTPAQTLCSNNTPIFLLAQNQGGNWNGNGVNPLSGGFNPSAALIGTNTIYYSMVQNGCVDLDSVQVQILQAPNAGILNAPSALCENNASILLNAAELGGTWYGSGMSNANSGLFSPALAGVGTAVVYHARNQANCSDLDSVLINIVALPFAAISPSGVLAVCQGDLLTLSSGAGQSYQWFLGQTPLAGANTQSIQISGAGNYSVAITDGPGCTSLSTPITVVENPKPELLALQLNTVCLGQPTHAQAALAVPFSGLTYQWDFAGQAASNNALASFNFTQAGTYPVSLIVTAASGCADTLIQQAVVNPNPAIVSLSASNVCVGSSVTFNAQDTIAQVNNASIVSQTWNFGNGTVGSGNSYTQTFAQIGNYTYVYTATSNQGCSVSQSGTYQVFPLPTAAFNANSGCEGESILFSNLSTGGMSSFWSFGNGDTSILTNPVYAFTAPGVYVANLTVTDMNGCAAQASQAITIAPGPPSAFGSTPMGGLTYQFTPTQISGGAQYTWTFGDGSASSDITPVKTYLFSGNYSVCLNVIKGNCSTQTCQNVQIFTQAGTETNSNTTIAAYPNPFSENLNVNFELAHTGEVKITLFDLAGKQITQQVHMMDAGQQNIGISATTLQLASGVYLMQVEAQGTHEQIRVVHIKN
jgi:PKD repeat protein